MLSRFALLNAGLFPETLPPCFVSKDAGRAFHGIVMELDKSSAYDRRTDFVPYNGTKHDGSRRRFGTPNIITYFHISQFISKHWGVFSKQFESSPYSIGRPALLPSGSERSIKVPSLSDLSRRTTENLRHAPFVLQADIAQCFSSIYTHSIPWAAHGMDESKKDTKFESKTVFFNQLDFFIRNGQKGNTQGVLIGPDAYRLVAEFILSKIDTELEVLIGDKITGGIRHVDDYYFGLRSEIDAQFVLSALRDILATYTLNLNDQKTRIFSSLQPINDLWAQRLRDHTTKIGRFDSAVSSVERAVSEAVAVSQEIGSDSPLKIVLRSIDENKIYRSVGWTYIEHYLQRICQKHPHVIDYVCLLVAKRHALDLSVDLNGWIDVAGTIISRAVSFNHHHEAAWMLWLLFSIGCDIPDAIVDECLKSRNGHLRAMIIQANSDGLLRRKPKLGLGSGLSTMDADWLAHLVARSNGFSKASFSGNYAQHFEHLADKAIRLVDFNDHIDRIRNKNKSAISRVRYGYDDNESIDDDIVAPVFDPFE